MTIVQLHEPHFLHPGLHTEKEQRHVDWMCVGTVIGALIFITAAWTGVVTAVEFIAKHI